MRGGGGRATGHGGVRHAAARDVARVSRLTMRSTSCSRTEALAGDKKLATAMSRSSSEKSPWLASA